MDGIETGPGRVLLYFMALRLRAFADQLSVALVNDRGAVHASGFCRVSSSKTQRDGDELGHRIGLGLLGRFGGRGFHGVLVKKRALSRPHRKAMCAARFKTVWGTLHRKGRRGRRGGLVVASEAGQRSVNPPAARGRRIF